MKIERVVVTGGQDFTDEARIEADLRALLPVGLRRVAQGGHNVDEQFGQAETPRRIRSADALAWLVTARLHLDGATYRVNRDVEISTDAAGDTQTVYRLPVPPDVDGGWPSAGPRRSKQRMQPISTPRWQRPGPRHALQRSEVAVVTLFFGQWEWYPRLGNCTQGRGGFRSQEAAVDDALAHGYGAVVVDGKTVARNNDKQLRRVDASSGDGRDSDSGEAGG